MSGVPTFIIESRTLNNKKETWLVRTFVNVEIATEDIEIGLYISW
jgi:hypothetical protein